MFKISDDDVITHDDVITDFLFFQFYFCNLKTESPLKLKICMSVVHCKDNMLTKFRENPMHVVHVVRARMCTEAILGYFSDIQGYNGKNGCLNSA